VVADATIDRFEALVRQMREHGRADAYIERTLTVARAALNRAHRRGEILAVPHVPTVGQCPGTAAVPPREPYRMTRDESAALLQAALGHVRTFCLVAYCTVSRPGAVLNLQPFQIDLARRLIRFGAGAPQSNKRRPTVPICDTLVPVLRRNMAQSYIVMPRGKRARPLKSIKHGFALAVARAGLDPCITPYSIRHTVATELRAAGVPEYEIAGFLGHTRLATTDQYAAYRPDYLGAAAAAIDAYMADSGVFQEAGLSTDEPTSA
jgi:integrase